MPKLLQDFIYITIGKLARTLYRITLLPYPVSLHTPDNELRDRIQSPLRTVPQEVRKLATESSAQFVISNMRTALIFDSITEFWDYALAQVKPSNAIGLEFGVWKGESIRYFANKFPNFQFFGFDSFEGLEEDWAGSRQPKGYFHLHGQLPEVPDNVKLIKGFYTDTLPNFIKYEFQEISSIQLIHLDSDTYKPTKLILSELETFITPGTVLIFDEYLGLPFWEETEHRAFTEFILETGHHFRYIAISNLAVAVLIIS